MRTAVTYTQQQSGFVGTIRLALLRTADHDAETAFTTLMRYAVLAGIGAQTTHGFGAANLIRLTRHKSNTGRRSTQPVQPCTGTPETPRSSRTRNRRPIPMITTSEPSGMIFRPCPTRGPRKPYTLPRSAGPKTTSLANPSPTQGHRNGSLRLRRLDVSRIRGDRGLMRLHGWDLCR
ncbi:MAG: CRISPR system precrRNA processing endoribonuclease RAMP protein Cas6 [Sciscionella sp.]